MLHNFLAVGYRKVDEEGPKTTFYRLDHPDAVLFPEKYQLLYYRVPRAYPVPVRREDEALLKEFINATSWGQLSVVRTRR